MGVVDRFFGGEVVLKERKKEKRNKEGRQNQSTFLFHKLSHLEEVGFV